MSIRITPQLLAEARDYYRLCETADALGIPTSLDDPGTPTTVQALRNAVAAK